MPHPFFEGKALGTRLTSPIWGPPPPSKQALNLLRFCRPRWSPSSLLNLPIAIVDDISIIRCSRRHSILNQSLNLFNQMAAKVARFVFINLDRSTENVPSLGSFMSPGKYISQQIRVASSRISRRQSFKSPG